MNRKTRKNWLLNAATVFTALVLAAPTARASKPDEAPSPAKPVVVKNTVQVDGDVSATINGTVPVLVENQDPIPVEGDVFVINPDPIPVTGDVNATVKGLVAVENFDSQLDALRSDVQEVRQAVDDLKESDRIPWVWTWGLHEFMIQDCASPAPGRWDGLQLAVISTDSDAVRIKFYREENCAGGPVFTLGAKGSDFPTVLPLSFPVPINEFKSMRAVCNNSGPLFLSCQVDLSMVGSKPAP